MTKPNPMKGVIRIWLERLFRRINSGGRGGDVHLHEKNTNLQRMNDGTGEDRRKKKRLQSHSFGKKDGSQMQDSRYEVM